MKIIIYTLLICCTIGCGYKSPKTTINLDNPVTITQAGMYGYDTTFSIGKPKIFFLYLAIKNNTNAEIERVDGVLSFYYDSLFVDSIRFGNMIKGFLKPNERVVYRFESEENSPMYDMYKSTGPGVFKTEKLNVDESQINVDFRP